MAMTQAEIKSLMEQARREERAAKTMLKQRSAELRARMEEQLAAAYRADHAQWQAITQEAEQWVKEWDDQIAAICRDMGVPEEFRPRLTLSWYSRGENASSTRRAELRKVGEARIAELETAGQAAIEVRSVQIQRELVAGGLRSDEAKCLLASLPSADELMPDLSLEELEQAVPLPQPHGRGGGDSGAPAAEGTGGPAQNTSASSSCAERAGLPRLSRTWGHSTSWP